MYNFFLTLHPGFELIAILRATNILEKLLGDWQQNLRQRVTNSTRFTVNCSIMVSLIDNYMKNSLFGTKMLDILLSTCNATYADTLLDSRSV